MARRVPVLPQPRRSVRAMGRSRPTRARLRPFLGPAGLLLALVSAGCGGNVVFDEPNEDADDGAGGGDAVSATVSAASGTSGSTTGGSAAQASSSSGGVVDAAQVRVAHLSPGTPAVDFCVLPPNGGAAIGPVLAGAGAPNGLAFSEVTAYVELPPATYAVRLVAPGSDCSVSIAGLPDVAGVTVEAGRAYTAAATGILVDAGPTDARFAVALYTDDLSVDAANVRARFIHASPDTPPVDVGLGSGLSFTPVWTNVPFGQVGRTEGGDYVTVAPLSSAQLSARASGTTADALILDGVTLPAGSVVTVFAIGNLDGAPAPLAALACLDGQGACLVLP